MKTTRNRIINDLTLILDECNRKCFLLEKQIERERIELEKAIHLVFPNVEVNWIGQGCEGFSFFIGNPLDNIQTIPDLLEYIERFEKKE